MTYITGFSWYCAYIALNIFAAAFGPHHINSPHFAAYLLLSRLLERRSFYSPVPLNWRSLLRFIGLLMVAGVIGFSHSAEGQAVEWVEGGINSEVPENAIRVRVDGGRPLCRGTLAEDQGQGNFWLDIGVVNPKQEGKCHTLRGKKTLRLQENFYYLVPAETEGEVSTEGMVLESDVEARIAEATAQLEADLQAVHDQTQGMFSEAEVEAQISEAMVGMYSEADVEGRVNEELEGMVAEYVMEERVSEANFKLQAAHEQIQGMYSHADVEERVNEAMVGMVSEVEALVVRKFDFYGFGDQHVRGNVAGTLQALVEVLQDDAVRFDQCRQALNTISQEVEGVRRALGLGR